MGMTLSTLTSVAVEKLACIRGGRLLFRDLSFSASAGEVLSIEGPNGIGKPPLPRVIAGFLPPAEGSIVINTERAISAPEKRRTPVGWPGHQAGVKSQLTAGAVLDSFA